MAGEERTPQGLGQVIVFCVLVYQHPLLVSHTTSFELNEMSVFDSCDENHFLEKIGHVLLGCKKSLHSNDAPVR